MVGAVLNGAITFPDGTRLEFGPDDWKDLVKFIYSHVDGPVKTEMDVTSNGETIALVEVVKDYGGNNQ